MLEIGVVGISYKTAPLKVRESVARQVGQLFNFGLPCVLLTTCNRFEIYFSASDLHQASLEILKRLEGVIGDLDRSSFYSFFEHQCFFHLAKVISGLDSAIMGESDIQRQVKKAYQLAHERGRLSKEIHFLFQKSLRIGKRLRTDFLQKQKMMTLERYILEKVDERGDQPILFFGYSDVNRKLIKEFQHRNVKALYICTRAQEVDLPGVEVIGFDQRRDWIHFPIVVVGTKSPDYLLKEQHLYMNEIKTRLIFDLGIPRLVEPQVGQEEGIELIDLESVASYIEEKRAISNLDVLRCEAQIASFTQLYEASFALREENKARLLLSV